MKIPLFLLLVLIVVALADIGENTRRAAKTQDQLDMAKKLATMAVLMLIGGGALVYYW